MLDLRLVGGNRPGEGRVEIFHNGNWGTVCDDKWDINDAQVVCREHRYGVALSAPPGAHFGSGHGQIWLDDVQCQGNEISIVDCQHAGWGIENCGHSEDASVICSSKYHHKYICIAVYCFYAYLPPRCPLSSNVRLRNLKHVSLLIGLDFFIQSFT